MEQLTQVGEWRCRVYGNYARLLVDYLTNAETMCDRWSKYKDIMDLPYLKFYGLKEEPFSTVPSPRYLFLTAVHSTALEKTSYVVGAKKGLAAVFGDTGTGKSTLARLLHQKFLDAVKPAGN